MSQTHLHLMLNHIPIFSTFFGGLMLLWGLLKRDKSFVTFSLFILIAGAISSFLSLETGEAAEDTVKKLQGIILVKGTIHNHEEAAELALVASIIFALIAPAVFYFWDRFKNLKPWLYFSIVIYIFALTTHARTAYLGGLIRHTEINDAVSGSGETNATTEIKEVNKDKEDDDDK